jgi:hypothetical protein
MRFDLLTLLLSSTLAIAGCSKTAPQPSASGQQVAVETQSSPTTPATPAGPSTPAAATAVKPKVDACALLTSKEVESVQGEAIKETKLSGQSAGGYSMSQCFFTLPTLTNSISLLVAQKGEGAGANDPRDFWRNTFHEKAGEKGRERERERDKKKGEEEEEEGAPPQKVTGIGDEAYWTGSSVGGALYVLKGNSYIRLSIGGAAKQATRIKKSKALAAKAISRL